MLKTIPRCYRVPHDKKTDLKAKAQQKRKLRKGFFKKIGF